MKEIEVISRAVILDGTRILLCKGKGNYYCLPGGHVEFGETAEAALRRELMEELGAEVKSAQFIGSHEKIFEKEGTPFELLEHSQSKTVGDVLIEGHGELHAPIYSTVPQVINTGYFISGRLFYPGDALYNPGKSVEILALPVAGPWVKISEAIDYAKTVKPKIAFHVHDGMLKIIGPYHRVPQDTLSAAGIGFTVLPEGQETEF